MKQIIILETPRTYLRQINESDFDSIASILQDLEVMYAWEHAFSDQEVRWWIQENIRRYEADGYSYWAVIEKNKHDLIGVCGIISEKVNHEDCVGIGYIFNKKIWRQGFAFECASACKNYAFQALNISFLTAQIRPENSASKKVAQKIGMSVCKQFDRFYRGKQIRHLLYGCENHLSGASPL